MVEVLARISDDETLPYFGDARLVQLEEEQKRSQKTGNARVRSLFELGMEQLEQGKSQAAAQTLEALFEEERRRPTSSVKMRRALEFHLAIAWLRKGETDNCVARHTSQSCLFPIQGSGVHKNQEGSRKAIAHLLGVLKQQPGDVRARWLLNVAYMTTGEYPEGVPAAHRIPLEPFESKEAFPRFTDVAPELGVNSFNRSGGAVAEDFDGDGLVDVIASSWDTGYSLDFFHNNGDGTFSSRGAQAGFTGITGGLNLVFGDYNNDGHPDLYVLRGAWLNSRGRHPNSLLRNNGDGTFTDVTFEAGLGLSHHPTQTAAFGDYDNDGDLDLYVGNEHFGLTEAPSQLFRNNGDGTFSDVAEVSGVRNERWTKGVVFGDYNGDRFPDLYVSNYSGDNRLYRNNQDGTFTDVAKELGVTGPHHGFPTWFWDVNNDGKLDIFASAYDGRVGDVVSAYLSGESTVELPALYLANGSGGFENRATEYGLSKPSLAMGANFGDLDNDGYSDFYLGTGYPGFDGLMPNVMYWNRGGRRFSDVTTAGGFGHLQKGHAVAFLDWDLDGDQDVFEQMGGAFKGDDFGNALYENPGFSNHWIRLKLVGKTTNRSAIGARVRVDFRENGKERSVYRDVSSGGSFGGNSLVQHIGVGKADVITRVLVQWPTSQTEQSFKNVAVDRSYQVTEHGTLLAP